LSWINTLPDSKEKAEYIIEYSKDKKANYESALAKDKWDKVKEKLTE
jgi:hypothetical protein